MHYVDGCAAAPEGGEESFKQWVIDDVASNTRIIGDVISNTTTTPPALTRGVAFDPSTLPEGGGKCGRGAEYDAYVGATTFAVEPPSGAWQV
jgi:hypothetical protein